MCVCVCVCVYTYMEDADYFVCCRLRATLLAYLPHIHITCLPPVYIYIYIYIYIYM